MTAPAVSARSPVALAVLGSFLIHAAAVPLATALGRAACPLLDSTGSRGIGAVMFATLGSAWALRWAATRRWWTRWSLTARGEPTRDSEVPAILAGPFRGACVHVVAFLAGTTVGAVLLTAVHGHDFLNWRFWYSAFLSAGFVVTLDAVLLEWLLARSLVRTGTTGWRYRSCARFLELRNLVVFAIATLPAAVLTALVYRRAVLDSAALSGMELVTWLAKVGGVTLGWSVAVTILLRAVERLAADEALGLIREISADASRDVIPARANVVTGGPWGETAAALNSAADAIEQRTRLDRAVRTYVGDEVAEAARGGDVTTARGERVRMTVLFADIRGFTKRSSTETPERIVALLDRYFAEAVEAMEAHGGHVDKFIGDGLMAWFEERGGGDSGARNAVAAAEELLRRVATMGAALSAAGEGPFEIGVGLHAGDVIRGNLGAGRRKQWTVIGDTVNLASRVESLTKELGEPLVFTASVAQHVDPVRVRPLGESEVRGQPRPVAVFTVRAATS